MNATFSTGKFDIGNTTDGVRQMVDQVLGAIEKRTGTRAGRGDVRTAILSLLHEQPMHGYQIIREIEQRSGGSWKPSAGSVYPTLQLMAEEGLLSTAESNGRKTYTLTEAGTEAAAEVANEALWEPATANRSAAHTALPKAGFALAQAAAQLGRSGTATQIERGTEILHEARRALYAILAED